MKGVAFVTALLMAVVVVQPVCQWLSLLLLLNCGSAGFFSVTAVATLQCYPGSSCDSFYYCVTIPCNHFKAVLVLPRGLLVDKTHQSLNSLKIISKGITTCLFTCSLMNQVDCMAKKGSCF